MTQPSTRRSSQWLGLAIALGLMQAQTQPQQEPTGPFTPIPDRGPGAIGSSLASTPTPAPSSPTRTTSGSTRRTSAP
jgi:hypothetical protein